MMIDMTLIFSKNVFLNNYCADIFLTTSPPLLFIFHSLPHLFAPLTFYPNFSQNVYACFISSLMDPLRYFCSLHFLPRNLSRGRPACVYLPFAVSKSTVLKEL